eukprot:44570-Rhodomonas_salina.1
MTQRRKALLTTSTPRKDPMVESETNTAIVSASCAQNSQSHTAKQIPPPHGSCLSIDAEREEFRARRICRCAAALARLVHPRQSTMQMQPMQTAKPFDLHLWVCCCSRQSTMQMQPMQTAKPFDLHLQNADATNAEKCVCLPRCKQLGNASRPRSVCQDANSWVIMRDPLSAKVDKAASS